MIKYKTGVAYPSVDGIHGKRANGVSNFLWVVHCDNEYRLQPIIVSGLRICGLEIGCIYLGKSKNDGVWHRNTDVLSSCCLLKVCRIGLSSSLSSSLCAALDWGCAKCSDCQGVSSGCQPVAVSPPNERPPIDCSIALNESKGDLKFGSAADNGGEAKLELECEGVTDAVGAEAICWATAPLPESTEGRGEGSSAYVSSSLVGRIVAVSENVVFDGTLSRKPGERRLPNGLLSSSSSSC